MRSPAKIIPNRRSRSGSSTYALTIVQHNVNMITAAPVMNGNAAIPRLDEFVRRFVLAT